MTSYKDLDHLQDVLDFDPVNYVEFARGDRATAARRRWPMLDAWFKRATGAADSEIAEPIAVNAGPSANAASSNATPRAEPKHNVLISLFTDR